MPKDGVRNRQPASTWVANKSRPCRNILIVDDCEDDILLLEHAFQLASIKHSRKYLLDGRQAIDYLQHKPPFQDKFDYPFPDLLILDLKMPGMDGFDVLEWLRDQSGLALPVIVLSGSNHPEDRERALRLGAVDYCVKSFTLHELIEMVQRICDEAIA